MLRPRAEILLPFATGHLQKRIGMAASRHQGCDDCDDGFMAFFFSILGADHSSFTIAYKHRIKIVLFSLCCRDPVLELQFLLPLRVVPWCFGAQSR